MCIRDSHKAEELLSGTVAVAIGFLLPGQGHVIEFVQTVNDGFDMLNSRMPHHSTNKIKSTYGTCLEVQDEALNRLHTLCLPMRVIGKSCLLPFQLGLVIPCLLYTSRCV